MADSRCVYTSSLGYFGLNHKGNDTFSSGSLSVHTAIFNIELKNTIQMA